MKKFFMLVSFIFCVSCFAAHQYDFGVYWGQSKESKTLWDVTLNTNNNYFKEYGLYSLSEASKNINLQNWVNGENYFKLDDGTQSLNITDNLGIFVKTSRNTYSSMSLSDFYNFKSVGFDSNGYSVYIYNDKIGNDDWVGQIIWEENRGGLAPTGQPLPGVLATMIIGGAVAGTLSIKRRKKIDEQKRL